jgi:sensor histidine kinase YesM
MLISLVENAIKHGVEPAPAGGQITVAAEMRAAGVALMVADTGCGIGKSSASGGGVGLANVRERLNAIYGEAARLMLSEREGGGAVALIEIDDQLVAAREGT